MKQNFSVYFQDLCNCTYNSTAFSNGDGSINSQSDKTWHLLLNHKPSCHGSDGGAIMTGFKLEKNGTDIRYNFSCCNFKDPVCQVRARSTNWTDIVNGSFYFLEKLAINCGRVGFINSFQLKKKNAQLKYSFTCYVLFDHRWMKQAECITRSTQSITGSMYLIYQLVQVPVQCEPGFGLSRVHLKTVGPKMKWRFSYRCCRVVY